MLWDKVRHHGATDVILDQCATLYLWLARSTCGWIVPGSLKHVPSAHQGVPIDRGSNLVRWNSAAFHGNAPDHIGAKNKEPRLGYSPPLRREDWRLHS